MLDNYEDYKTLGKDIFNYDAGKGMSALLKDWFKRTLRKEKDLRMEFLSEDLDEYLKDPSAVLVAKEAIKRAADNRPLPIKVLFVNKIDKNDNKEYETLDEALASVKDNPYIMAFASDPKAVFKQIWRVVNADGSLGGKVSEDAVDHFIDSFDGDKKALRAKLGRPEQRQQNQQKAYNKPNQGDGKKGNKPGKPNKPSDNSTSTSSSGAGN